MFKKWKDKMAKKKNKAEEAPEVDIQDQIDETTENLEEAVEEQLDPVQAELALSLIHI